ncbi:hypothetical protein QW060_10030 [Myroides ceti]|uniref:Uncharacterized protein n=1 Tax=Paenimyroides ceti TaxID=395087 RepID=A0ABT8CUZ5_9FLAO|nr:hypothetical protein [Paenimyroides ceti]MDN3707468.1 hypothetical protein [Paenimyroides ceti]
MLIWYIIEKAIEQEIVYTDDIRKIVKPIVFTIGFTSLGLF